MSGVPAWHSKLKAEAKALGQIRFRSDHPCKRGHVGEWYVRDGRCVECERIHMKEKAATENGKASADARLKRYRAKHAEELKLRAKTPENRAKNRKRQAEWGRNNPEKRKAYVERYEMKDPERLKTMRNARSKKYLQNNPLIKSIRMTRLLVWNSLKRKNCKKLKRTTEILGCSFEFFQEHIERQFVKGMNWDNKKEWHIDHIVPLSSATTKEEVIALNHFTNLRPLFAKDNRAKGDKITHLI